MIRINDIYRIQPDKRFASLSAAGRVRLMDSVLNVEDAATRGLEVTFNLTNAGRRINNRIYMPRGQAAGAANAIGKPIIKNHDSRDVDNIVGRFTDVRFNVLDHVAMTFFDNADDFMSVKRAFDSDDPERIYKVLRKYNLLTNDNWQGLSELEAVARIADEEAIEKFLNGTYLDFSAGATTDRWVCTCCMQDWAQDGPCDHRPGSIVDGDLALGVLGSYDIEEGSIVFKGANAFSKVRSLQLIDSEGSEVAVPKSWDSFSDSAIYVTDAHINDGVLMGAKSTTGEAGAQAFDVSALADALVPLLIEKLNTELPPAVTDTEVVKSTDVEDTNEAVQPENQPVVDEADTKVKTEVVDSEDVVEPVVPWTLLDMAFDIELNDAKLGDEAREALADSAFCGPNRSFPVPDSAHVDAARRLIDRADLSDAQKAKALESIDEKAEAINCDSTQSTCDNCKCKDFDQLTVDYANALNQIEELRNQVEAAAVIADNQTTELDTEAATTDNETDDGNSTVATEDISAVENNSVASTEDAPTQVNLSDFEKNVITRYKNIRDNEGQSQADRFLAIKMRKKHIPRTFDITLYLEEN